MLVSLLCFVMCVIVGIYVIVDVICRAVVGCLAVLSVFVATDVGAPITVVTLVAAGFVISHVTVAASTTVIAGIAVSTT